MKEKLCTVSELSKITGLSLNRMYTYMGRYGFEKFRTISKVKNRTMQLYRFNKEFAYRLCDLFSVMNRQDCIDKIIDYCELKESKEKQ